MPGIGLEEVEGRECAPKRASFARVGANDGDSSYADFEDNAGKLTCTRGEIDVRF